MTLAVPTLIAVFVFAAAAGAAACMVLMRRRVEAAFDLPTALSEENERLTRQLARAESLTASVRAQLEGALARSRDRSAVPTPSASAPREVFTSDIQELSTPTRLTPTKLVAPPKLSADPILAVGGPPDERIDDAGRWRTSGIQELGSGLPKSEDSSHSSGIRVAAGRTVVLMPESDEIATLARSLWQAAGRPFGRDREFWFQAEAQLISQRVALSKAAGDQPLDAEAPEIAAG